MDKIYASAAQPIAAIIVGLLAGAIAIMIAGGDILQTYAEMWKGAFGGMYFFTNTLSRRPRSF